MLGFSTYIRTGLGSDFFFINLPTVVKHAYYLILLYFTLPHTSTWTPLGLHILHIHSTWIPDTPLELYMDSTSNFTWAPHRLHINSRSTTLGVQVKSTWKWYYHWIGFWKIFNVGFLALDTNTFWPYICSWSWSICHIYLPVFLPCEIRPRQHNGSLPKVLKPPFENLSHCGTFIWQVWQHPITVK